MDRYENKEALADKIEWEGGTLEAILGYGIYAAELPEDTPDEIVKAWERMEAASTDATVIDNWLYPE